MRNLTSAGDHRLLLRRIVIYGAAIFFVGIIQCAFFSRLKLFGVTPDLILGTLIAILLLDNKYAAAVAAVGAGYFIYPKFWGKGYTTEAFKRVLEFAFSENNVYRVSTGCLAENVGSERVMQKSGLIKEAEHVDYEWHDGKMKTRLEYRLLRNEWR